MTQVAIDGPASSGKSSVGSRVAAELGFGFLDTGLLYRAVTCAAIDADNSLDQAESGGRWTDDRIESIVALAFRTRVDIERGGAAISVDSRRFAAGELESEAVERTVATVAALSDVRAALRTIQRDAAMRGGIVLAGRDIGTVVYPEARHKFYLDASAEARALRRALQRGYEIGSSEHRDALNGLLARDREDRTRAAAPLRAADDARIIMTDDLSLADVVETIVREVRP